MQSHVGLPGRCIQWLPWHPPHSLRWQFLKVLALQNDSLQIHPGKRGLVKMGSRDTNIIMSKHPAAYICFQRLSDESCREAHLHWLPPNIILVLVHALFICHPNLVDHFLYLFVASYPGFPTLLNTHEKTEKAWSIWWYIQTWFGMWLRISTHSPTQPHLKLHLITLPDLPNLPDFVTYIENMGRPGYEANLFDVQLWLW